jgi:hypothetical protein
VLPFHRSLRSYAPLSCVLFALIPSAFGADQKQLQCSVTPAVAATPADESLAAGDLPKAETLYTAQLDATPTVASYAGLVRIQIERNEIPQSLATAQKAAAAFPASAQAQSLVGDALFRAGQIPESSLAFAAALRLDQCSPRGHLGHGRVNELLSRHAVAAAELATAHGLSPFDPEITAAWLETLSNPQRGSALRAILDSKPILPPATVERLSTQLSLIEQQALCTPTAAFTTAKLDLAPLMFNGLFIRSWGLQVRFNDKSNSLLELDSSVSGIVLNPKDAEKAGVRPLTTRPTDPNTPYTGIADTIRIGAIEFHGCPVRVVPAAALANSESLIGTEFFRDHLIHIDYVAKLLTLTPLPIRPATAQPDPYVAPEEKDWSPVYISGPNVLVPSLLNKKGPVLLLLDTGVHPVILSPAAMPSTVGKHEELTYSLKGSSGEILKVVSLTGDPDSDHTLIHAPDGSILKAYTPAQTPMLRFTNNERNALGAIAFDISPKSHEARTEISGVLGFGLLSDFSIDINYRDGLAQILLDQNHRYRERERQKIY